MLNPHNLSRNVQKLAKPMNRTHFVTHAYFKKILEAFEAHQLILMTVSRFRNVLVAFVASQTVSVFELRAHASENQFL